MRIPALILMATAAPIAALAPSPRPPEAMRRVAPALADYTDTPLFGDVWKRPGLSARDRSVVTIATLIANGRTAQLAGHIERGLDNGVTPTEIGGIITHLAFYAGWPKAFSGVTALGKLAASAGEADAG